MKSLWTSDDTRVWKIALARYDAVVARQGVPSLAPLDRCWTPVMVERALWSHVGGKRGVSPQARR